MLFPVTRSVFRWSTPDPNDDWLMIGHLLLSDGHVILVDPPVVPGLLDAATNLGGLEAVILTTGDHVRGSLYYESHSDARVYIPHQTENDIDELSDIMRKNLKRSTVYSEGDDLPGGIKPFRAVVERRKSAPSINEMMLLTPNGELLAGDIAMGSPHGELLTRNEFFYTSPNQEDNAVCLKTIASVVRKSKAMTLLASHGHDLKDNLQQALSRKT